MNYYYKIDNDKALKLFGIFREKKIEAQRVAIIESMKLVSESSTADFMELRGFSQIGESIVFGKRKSNKLHINTGRLARSLSGGFNLSGKGSLSGVREGIRHIRKAGDSIKGVLGSKVPYARIHEFGGGNIPARPYLNPALNKQRPFIDRVFQKRIQELIKKLDGK